MIVKHIPSAVVAQRTETLGPELLQHAAATEDVNQPYCVGPGDTLLVAVYGHPELSIAPYSGAIVGNQSTRLAGLVVDNDGTIQFPLIGSTHVAGKSANDLRLYLEHELAAYVTEPRVTVQVVYTRSLRYYLLGQFTEPGLKFGDRPMRLLEALSLAGSIALERASLRTAYVARNGRRLPIDFRRLVLEGDLTQNIFLHSGDIVMVPDRTGEQAFVFGAAASSNPRGGAVPFVNGRLNLLQALAQAGFGFRDQVQSRLSSTYVIRSSGARGELFTIDATQIFEGKAAPFELVPGDVVMVPPSGLTSWSETLQLFLPTFQAVSGVLTPFVEIKYLSQ